MSVAKDKNTSPLWRVFILLVKEAVRSLVTFEVIYYLREGNPHQANKQGGNNTNNDGRARETLWFYTVYILQMCQILCS